MAIPPVYDDGSHPVEGCLEPDPKCPKCGADKWRSTRIPGQADKRMALLKLADWLMFASFALGAAAIACLFLPDLYFVSFLSGGSLAVLLPAIRALRDFANRMPDAVSQCESCGFSVAE